MSASKYPAIGRIFEARFGDLAYHLSFENDGRTMTFSSIGDAKPVADAKVTVTYTAVEIAADVFMVYWKEPDGSTVTHVEDFAKGVVHTNITLPGHEFLNYTGTFKPVQ